MERKRQLFTLRRGLAGALMLLFAFSGVMAARDFARSARERAANKQLVRRVEQRAGQPTPVEVECLEADQEALPQPRPAQPERNYQPLLAENNHLAAWLVIEGTEVDYPVLYTPDDPEFYLHKAFDGSYARSGSLFVGAGCVPDGSNIIIYGHNMKDGSMFGNLDAYADVDYAKAHPDITYDLIGPDGSYQQLTFEVMAAFYSRVYKINEEDVFRYYYGTDLSDPEEFQSYVTQAMSASLYDLGVTAEYGERLLTLSTCSYHTEQGRFVVLAREKRTGV